MPLNASRKYIDLIKEATSKWASWDPPKLIEAGDYGKIDKSSGQFEKEGNIYTTTNTAISDIAKRHPPVRHEPDREFVANSLYARARAFNLDAQVGDADVPSPRLKGQWEFGSKRAAFLMMYRPRTTSIPNEFLQEIIEIPNNPMFGKSVVVEVLSCPAYALYLSSGTTSKEVVTFALRTDLSAGVLPGLTPAASLDAARWSHEGVTGLYREGAHEKESFYPLFSLKSIKKPWPGYHRRDGNGRDGNDVEETPDFIWGETDVPWEYLDDDGEEILEEDEASDSDSS